MEFPSTKNGGKFCDSSPCFFSQGTAFVKFASAESVDKCIAASESDGIFLDGRQVTPIS